MALSCLNLESEAFSTGSEEDVISGRQRKCVGLDFGVDGGMVVTWWSEDLLMVVLKVGHWCLCVDAE